MSQTPHPTGLRQGAFFALGAALLVMGVAALVLPRYGSFLIGAFSGWMLWLAGAAMLGWALLVGGKRQVAGGLSSLVAIIAGAFLLTHPTVGAYATALVVTTALLADGAYQLAVALDLKPLKVWRWVFASALASLLAALGAALAAAGDMGSLVNLFMAVAVSTSGLGLIGLGASKRLDPHPAPQA